MGGDMDVKKNYYVEEWNGRREITEVCFDDLPATLDRLQPPHSLPLLFSIQPNAPHNRKPSNMTRLPLRRCWPRRIPFRALPLPRLLRHAQTSHASTNTALTPALFKQHASISTVDLRDHEARAPNIEKHVHQPTDQRTPEVPLRKLQVDSNVVS